MTPPAAPPGPVPRVRRAAVAAGYALYVLVVAVAVTAAIGAAARAGVLIGAALPLGILLVAALAWLPDRAEHLGWVGLSVWLLATVYLGTGPQEWGALVVVLLLAAAGTVVSPWFLVTLWLVHPLWDLLPRDLPPARHDLPHACLVYDLVVAAYLVVQVRRGRFRPVRRHRRGVPVAAPGPASLTG